MSDKENENENESEIKKSGLTNPFIWLVALGIVIWWKWDEILGYF